MKTQSNGFTLSLEELTFLMRALKIKWLLGMDENLFEDLPPEIKMTTFNTAANSLRASGIVKFGENSADIQVKLKIKKILASFQDSEFSIMVGKVLHDEFSEIRFYHFSPNLIIEHSAPEAGIHRFVEIQKIEELHDRIIKFLDLEQMQASSANSQLFEVSLTESLQKLVNSNTIEDAYKLAKENSVNEKTAKIIIEPEDRWDILKFEYGVHDKPDHYSILKSDSSYWFLSPDIFNNQNMILESLNTNDLLQRLKSVYAKRED